MRASAKIPTFFNLTNPLSTQKPESRTITLPEPYIGFVSHSRVPTVLPLLSCSLLPRCHAQSFPSLNSTCQMMSLSTQPASCHSFPNFHSFLGTYMNPGHVYSLSHFDMDSSIVFIHDSKQFSSMFLFHASMNCCTSQNRSFNTGAALSMYTMFVSIDSNWFQLMYLSVEIQHPHIWQYLSLTKKIFDLFHQLLTLRSIDLSITETHCRSQDH